MEVTEILLPGVGVCYEFQTATGERVGVVAKRHVERFSAHLASSSGSPT